MKIQKKILLSLLALINITRTGSQTINAAHKSSPTQSQVFQNTHVKSVINQQQKFNYKRFLKKITDKRKMVANLLTIQSDLQKHYESPDNTMNFANFITIQRMLGQEIDKRIQEMYSLTATHFPHLLQRIGAGHYKVLAAS